MSGLKSSIRRLISDGYSACFGVPTLPISDVPRSRWNSLSTKPRGTQSAFVSTLRPLVKWLSDSAKSVFVTLVLWIVLLATVSLMTMIYPFLRPVPNGLNSQA